MKSSLRREIGLFESTSYGVGIILGAGIYALIGPAAGMAGNSVWASFVIGALISSFTGFSYAELSAMFPKAAAEYVYVKNSFRSELLAFLTGWLIIFTGAVSAATVALGFAGYFKALFNYPMVPTAFILILSLSFLNFCGIKESSRVNILFTAIELMGLLLIIFLGIQNFGKINYLEAPSVQGVLAAATLIFFAYLGFEDIVNIAEETEEPTKNVPKAIILSIIITTLLYVLVALSTVSLADWKVLGSSEAPLAYAASKALGNVAFSIMSYIALFATANTVLIISIVGSRMVYGMARDGVLPSSLLKVHRKTGTPWTAITCITVLSLLLLVLLQDIKFVAGITSLGVFITFLLVNLSVILLRYQEPELTRPFKTPLNIGKFPLISLFGLISCTLMITQFDLNAILSGVLVLGMGTAIYMIYKQFPRKQRKRIKTS